MKYFELLDAAEVEAIHENALRLLKEVGVIFSYDPAVEILKKAGCKVDGQKVFFEKAIVEELRKFPPAEFILYGRSAESDVVFNQNALVMIPCYGAPFVHDLDKGRRAGVREDFINFTKLTQESPQIDMASTVPCEMTDIPVKKRTAEYIRTTLEYCEKPMVVSKDAKTMRYAFEQCSILYGDRASLIAKPRFISITDSFSPLSYDDTMLEMVIYCAENGIPQRIGGLGVAGLTTPVTLAGNLSQMTAEALAGIVLTQLIRPGVPVVLNNSSSCADMKSLGLTLGAPECAMVCAATAQMARFYGLPCRSGGAVSDAKVVDAQAGAESMMNLLTSALTGTNYILHACGILESYMVSSLEKFIVDEENCGIVKHLRKGIPVNEDTLAFDTMKQAGPLGEFVTHPHTLRHYRSLYNPRLFDRSSYQQWEENGSDDIAVSANREWKKRVGNYVPPELPKELYDALRSYVDSI
jgi:trimethylamine--corrinoid protein Co-methyltransferase